ncbi:hypothetical protein PHISCL_01215 [Aspergillus sclerotialis]|uniref:Chalcone isomerase domain-containing protein n=1 Tax=Aspergillus sclerotialis TaxID=2070753 RepID=A0A3A3A3X1_9EURO|nr:hypothetical protein PHISCL_01215 [Aspergillus sclerotialis]
MAALPSIQGRMPWRACARCIRQQYLQPNSSRLLQRHQPRFLTTTVPLRSAGKNPLRSKDAPPSPEDVARYKRSITRSAIGMAVCTAIIAGAIILDPFGLGEVGKADKGDKPKDGTMKLDGPDGFPGSGPSVIRVEGQDGADQIPTGTSTIPHFPSTIRLPKTLDPSVMKPGDEPKSSEGEEEYQLLGLGIRTVSFLRIQVYVVGMYIAKSDISELQQRLVRTALNPPGEQSVIMEVPGANNATSLVPAERQQLKELLLDPERGGDAWDTILKSDGIRTAFRIVPTRNTDFMHLRDGWVRGISARAQSAIAKSKETGTKTGAEFEDESFAAAMNDLKAVFGGGQRKSVPKGQTLVLVRNAQGAMDALFRPDSSKPTRWMGRVPDERISRLIWLNYLGGKNVSSESARKSIVDGVMGIVERPVGTVVQKIV